MTGKPAPFAIIATGVAALIALTVQLQTTVPLGGSAVRFNTSDILIALALPWALVWALLGGRQRISLLVNELGWFLLSTLVLATLVMGAGFALGYVRIGGLFPWALVKFAGWFALLGYLLVGFFLARQSGGRAARVFALVYILVSLATVAGYSLWVISGIDAFGGKPARLTAMAGNPNAYGLMLVCALVLSFACRDAIASRAGRYAPLAVSGLITAGIVLTGSLAAAVALCLLVPVALYLRVKWTELAGIILIGLAVLAILRLAPGHQLEGIVAADRKAGALVENEQVFQMTVGSRLDVIRDGLVQWMDAPLLGIGLGTQLAEQARRMPAGAQLIQIHNTPVWILVEFGLIGLLVFAALGAALVRAFLQRAAPVWNRPALAGSLPLAATVILICALTMAMAHELMYQRVIWLIFGLALAAPMANGKASRPNA